MPAFQHFLVLLTRMPNFWKRGLRQVWGDANCLTDSDVLRFQWPSVGAGWERGLLSFAHAQILHSDMTDKQLMEHVLSLPNTTVVVIRGAKDQVVPKKLMKKFFDQFPDVPIHELQGQGHDPFEEQVDVFVDTVGRILDQENA